jgi:hypothetical protein
VPDPRASGAIIAGNDLLAVDLVATKLMGFDPLKLKMYSCMLGLPSRPFGIQGLDEIQVLSNNADWRDIGDDQWEASLRFQPYPGWVGHMELDRTVNSSREVLAR